MNTIVPSKRNHFHKELQKNLILLLLISTFQGHAITLLQSTPVNVQYDSIYQWEFIDATESWSLDTRIIDLHYNANKDLLSCITQELEDNVWINTLKETYTYDVNNHKTGYFSYTWDSMNWIDKERITYEYTGNNLATIISERWENSLQLWHNELKTIYTYDSNGRELLKEEQAWYGTWRSVRRYTTTYTPSYKIKKVLWENSIDTTHWVNNYQEIYTYDANDNMIEQRNQCYFSNWMDSRRICCIYNANHRRILYVSDEWDTKMMKWVNPLIHSCYKWDINGNLLYYKLGAANDLSRTEHFSAIYNSANQLTDKTRHYGTGENSEYTYETDSTHYFIHEKSNGIVDTKETKNNVILYPNPSNGVFTIQLENNNPVKTIDVFNAIGACIFHQASSNDVRIPDAQPGIYFVKIDDGAHFYTKKIAIH